jgi:tripartite-type tricarboxylate transporter receptor subunit TctC
LTDIAGGNVEATVSGLPAFLLIIKSGKVKVIALIRE